MLCGINKGTRLSRFLLGSSKKYVAGVKLGVQTDTLDITGVVTETFPSAVIDGISLDRINDVIEVFKGVQMQHPPVYSALKHKGKPLYKLAREGTPVRKPPRSIEIHSIELKSLDKPYMTIYVHCSAGTYIRSLAHDIGQKLGCGALLQSLRRVETSNFSVDAAVSLEKFECMEQEDAFKCIIPMTEAISHMPTINADPEMMTQLKFGRPFRPADDFSSDDEICRHELTYFKVVDSDGNLAAIVEYDREIDSYNYSCVFVN
ncbi:tRNA pseudouridine synthase B [Desulfamplus magnetovallimortis]|uniref:tRNA pseudouridine(55) synthase n=1 Tax=Desulfamplus magnetovallimortis TaxID=1246637 RepID=A0A1W1H8Q3_9BACT|nr:tRNA pseudouridine(55) synthase TruB [Desulfamplus magnetovallimortis]SLM28851.1 tRNA pseudouridine synthase B [Desulfamplus magnetovallimortis]